MLGEALNSIDEQWSESTDILSLFTSIQTKMIQNVLEEKENEKNPEPLLFWTEQAMFGFETQQRQT